jgi:general secretion pathway protein M
MTDNFVLWWKARSTREQRLLLVMAVLAALVIGWLLVVRPLNDALEAAKARHGAAVVALAEAKARREVARPAAPASAGGMPIDSLLAQSAAENGFPGARIVRQGAGRVVVAIDAARPPALFGWIGQLEARGLIVERLRVQANPDRTLTAELGVRMGGR